MNPLIGSIKKGAQIVIGERRRWQTFTPPGDFGITLSHKNSVYAAYCNLAERPKILSNARRHCRQWAEVYADFRTMVNH
ncbi:Uncharacterised protein [Vibrio cholerae]|nr:Uncharacterised protein [Vibrio cholerae]CSD22372.1 Uncharacterised protein [Vibrio cholerae]